VVCSHRWVRGVRAAEGCRMTRDQKDLRRWKNRAAYAAQLAEHGITGSYEHSSWGPVNQFAAILAVLGGSERAKRVFLETNPNPQG
jgi:hypothetical protein